MADVRNFKLPGVWAKNAYTTIPTPPVVNLAYRNENLSQADIEQGQQYGAIGNSADWNQMLWLLSALANEGQNQGILSWSPLIDYAIGAWVMGTNGNVYTALKASGPATTTVNPATEEESEDMTWLNVTVKLQGGEENSGFILGGVIPFSGSFGGAGNRHPIPRGKTEPDTSWVLCDGGSDGLGGTVPDLRNRFIVGAGVSYAQGAAGGAATHTHTVTGTVGGHTLTVAELASHSHSILQSDRDESGQGAADDSLNSSSYWQSGVIAYTGSNTAHSHGFSNGSAGVSSNLPPYYALSYIMKVA